MERLSEPLGYQAKGSVEPTFAQTLGLYIAVFCATGLILAIAGAIFCFLFYGRF